jgi:hypothetical protein
MSRSGSDGSFKGKNGLAFGAQLYLILQHPPVSQIDRNSYDFREAQFETGHIDKGQTPGAVEVTHQVNIRLRIALAASH